VKWPQNVCASSRSRVDPSEKKFFFAVAPGYGFTEVVVVAETVLVFGLIRSSEPMIDPVLRDERKGSHQ
jgi:hypothetical protein